MEDLFSPVGKDNCLFFYFLSVISFALFLFVLVSTLFMKNNRMSMVFASLSPLVAYYMYRLMYSMCIRSL